MAQVANVCAGPPARSMRFSPAAPAVMLPTNAIDLPLGDHTGCQAASALGIRVATMDPSDRIHELADVPAVGRGHKRNLLAIGRDFDKAGTESQKTSRRGASS